MVEQFGMIVFPHNSSSQGSVQYSHGRHVRRFLESPPHLRVHSASWLETLRHASIATDLRKDSGK
jgi:hypothetical protein